MFQDIDCTLSYPIYIYQVFNIDNDENIKPIGNRKTTKNSSKSSFFAAVIKIISTSL